MKYLFLLGVLLSASAFTTVAQPARNDHKPINLIDTLKASGDFKTLVTLLKKSGLTATLKGAGPFTIFAPTDQAFGKLPAGTLEALKKDPARLRKLLLYHVTRGTLTTKNWLGGTDHAITMMGNTTEIQDNGFSAPTPQSQDRVLNLAFHPGTSEEKNDRLRSAGPLPPKDKIQDNGFTPSYSIVINNSAKVLIADRVASNGMIHVVDTVLTKNH